jgi:phage-related protein
MKDAVFLGDTKEIVRSFPLEARHEAGVQLGRVQLGLDPTDWKPMKTVGKGVREIRIRERSGAFRVIYTAAFADTVYVLHAFQKKAQRTPQRDLDIAARRYNMLARDR